MHGTGKKNIESGKKNVDSGKKNVDRVRFVHMVFGAWSSGHVAMLAATKDCRSSFRVEGFSFFKACFCAKTNILEKQQKIVNN